jgi:hypothetical protein
VENVNERLAEQIRSALVDGKLPCGIAFRIAKEFGLGPKEIGQVCNQLKIKVSDCQLGCF